MLQHVGKNDFLFHPPICENQSEVVKMQLFLLGELALLALKDGKIHWESLMKGKQLPQSCYEMLDENPRDASQCFRTVIETQQWLDTCIIASNIFRGEWGLRSLSLSDNKRLIAGQTFLTLCQDPHASTYKPASIEFTIYEVSRDTGLLIPRLQSRTSDLSYTPSDAPPALKGTRSDDDPMAGPQSQEEPRTTDVTSTGQKRKTSGDRCSPAEPEPENLIIIDDDELILDPVPPPPDDLQSPPKK